MSDIQKAAKHALNAQPWWLRYKGTILIVATGLISVISQIAAAPDWDGTTVGVVLTAIATAGTALVNRYTKDGFTPSMGPRLENAYNETNQ